MKAMRGRCDPMGESAEVDWATGMQREQKFSDRQAPTTFGQERSTA